MENSNLVLTIPQGSVIATSLGIAGLAKHLSPGSGKHFHGRAIYVDLAVKDCTAAFDFQDQGGWRNAQADTNSALAGVCSGKRTKTALSNSAFDATPLDAFKAAYIIKTGGQVLEMEPFIDLVKFSSVDCPDGLTPQAIAQRIGQPEPMSRKPRMYLVFAPVELLVISNLTPIEYAWYATRRTGKIFRQCCFAELKSVQTQLAAHARYEECFREISEKPSKKTKTVALTNLLNNVPFQAWTGFDRKVEGGLYFADNKHLLVARFPQTLPWDWEKAL
jgi:hypothetical protein